jgi:hypothetical protein
MIIKKWSTIYFSKPKLIAGISVKPLTIGDLVLFNELELPYDEEYRNKEMTMFELVTSLIVRKYSFNFVKFLLFNQRYSKWLYKYVYKRIRKQICKYGIDKAHADVINNLNYYFTTTPQIRKDASQIKTTPQEKSDTPMVLRIIAMFKLYFRLLEKDIFNLQLDYALWMLSIRVETEGMGTLKDLNNQETEEYLKGIEELKTAPDALQKMKELVGPEHAGKILDML